MYKLFSISKNDITNVYETNVKLNPWLLLHEL